MNRKIKTGLIGLMALGASSIAQAETIKLGNGQIDYINSPKQGYCLRKINVFDGEKSFGKFTYDGCIGNLVGVYDENDKLLQKNDETKMIYMVGKNNGLKVQHSLDRKFANELIEKQEKKLEELFGKN